ncbi:MAG: carbohydrate binding family 9 domain-containing protein [Bacteroidetes bacterium]|nr:carbohydrate binding family 9 domain-containing protein [Bacteroidota bacterium]
MRFIFAVSLCLLQCFVYAQEKHLPAIKLTLPVVVDGNLDDEAWKNLPAATDFITYSPHAGAPSRHRTEVKIAYDDNAVYIGAYLYGNPSGIRKQITARDVTDRQDADVFTLGFDTYLDRQNAFLFKVTAAGVQADAKGAQNNATVFDYTWDAVWESKVSIKADGWVAEIKIPFSAIRISKNAVQSWGLNFARFQRTDNEVSIWSPETPEVNGDINQWGTWDSLRNIKSPPRLSFLPYISGGVRVSPTANGDVKETLKSGGMDVKYGVSKSFTLDMTLIPDFAQVQSDNQLLNLTPFEIKFDDYRPFFTEGTELFNKAGIFYSRRIGAAPTGSLDVLNNYGNSPYYRIDKNPGITKLYNATKISGRTKENLGIGVFNAITAPMYAKVTNLAAGTDSTILTEPLANYNIIVLDQALKNRSTISFTNTNVLRKGNTRNANVGSVDLSLFDKKNVYNVILSGKLSNIWGNTINKTGYNANAGFAKVSGLLQYRGLVVVKSDQYDPNDMGYLLSNNSIDYTGKISYNLLRPYKCFNSRVYTLSFDNAFLYKPNTWTSLTATAKAFFLFRNYWDVTGTLITSPMWSNDYFINSTVYNGYFLRRKPYYKFSVDGSSDSRKKLYFNYSLAAAESPLPDDFYWSGEAGLRYRVNDKFQFSADMALEHDNGNWGWAFVNNTNGSPIIARRVVKTNTGIFSGQYNFNNRMNWTVRIRHYWSILDNTNFYDLKEDGNLNDRAFIPGKNINYNTFNIDMFYTWDFLLGSRITVAWKNALGTNVNISPYMYATYVKNLGQALSNPHSNEVSVKIVYYLDYLKLKGKRS